MQFAQLVDKRPSGVILSASQTEKWDRCKRRWALEYIGGIRPPPHPSALLGTDVHTILEAWLNFGTPPDIRTKAGKIAAKMIVNLPLPGTGVTERQFYLTTHNGISYTGKIDWSGIFHGWPTIVDHKTTGNLDYAKSAAQLHSDLQGLTYTIAGCLGFEVPEMQLLWNYGTTKGNDPVVVPERTRIHLKVAVEKFEHVVEPLAAEIIRARQSRADPMSFPPTPAACGDFGGCPHRHICNLSENERLLGIMTDAQNPSLASRLASFPTNGSFMPPGGAPMQPQFAAPPQPQFAAPPPQSQFTAPLQTAFAPPASATPQAGFMPPPGVVAPQQSAFTPPGTNGAPQAPQSSFAAAPPNLGYDAGQGPNPPESGKAKLSAPVVGGEGDKPKRPRGRPRKSEEEKAAYSEEVACTPDTNDTSKDRTSRDIYAQGVFAFMQSDKWNGQLDQLIWAGDMAVQAYNARFG